MTRIEIDCDGVDEVVRGIMEGTGEQVRAGLGELRCEEHGEEPMVRLSVTGEWQIVMEVEGCCEKLRAQVEEAIAGFE